MLSPDLPVPLPARVRAIPGRLRRSIRDRRAASHASAAIEGAIAEHAARLRDPRVLRWTALDAASGEGGLVVRLGPPGGPARALLRLADGEAARAGLAAEADVLARLDRTPALADWRSLVPEVLGTGVHERWQYVLETVLPGRTLRLHADPRRREHQLRAVVAAIAPLHAATFAVETVTPGLVERWVDRRIRSAAELLLPGPGERAGRDRLVGLQAELWATMGGRRVRTALVHGDLWAGNILVDGSEETARHDGGQPSAAITGIVDWDSATEHELPAHDLLHLLLYGRRRLERRPLGHVVADVLRLGLRPEERALLEPHLAPGLSERVLVLLYWLRFVEMNERRQPLAVRTGRAWRVDNVESVLRVG